jgi:uncharacterized SAM-binding protein YcdF (DUF218 family)
MRGATFPQASQLNGEIYDKIMALSIREKFISIVDNDTLKISDAIILLEGDGYNRVAKAVELFKAGWASIIVVSGGDARREYGSFPAEELKKKLLEFGIAPEAVMLESDSKNTREQATSVLALAAQNGWTKIILVASHYHQYRAYLTFLKAMAESGKKIQIFNSPVRDLAWFRAEIWGARIDLLENEFERMKKYRETGHIASFEEALDYQLWKEQAV